MTDNTISRLFIDIETAPTSRNDIVERIAGEIKPPGNIKKEESKQKWFEENHDTALWERVKATALDGTLGELFCIGYAMDNNSPTVIARGDIGFDWSSHRPDIDFANSSFNPIIVDDEKRLLSRFFTDLADQYARKDGGYFEPCFIGHYLTGFDLRFIWQRAVIHQIKPTVELPIEAKPWDSRRVFDTKTKWTGLHSRNSSGSLDILSMVMGGEQKTGLDGSKVADALATGQGPQVMSYCADDVIRTRHIFNRLTFQGNQ